MLFVIYKTASFVFHMRVLQKVDESRNYLLSNPQF